MKKHLTFVDGTSDKFWQIETAGLAYTVTYGKSGTVGTSQTKTFPTERECLDAAGKVISEKIKKGYSENGEPAQKSGRQAREKPQKTDIALLYDELVKSKKTDELLPFLIEYSKGNLEMLKKAIRKNRKYWLEYTDLTKDPVFRTKENYGWGRRGDDGHHKIIILSAIAVFNKPDILSWDEVFQLLSSPEDPETSQILEWAKPTWIADYLLEQRRRNEWQRFPYQKLRILEENGFIGYNPDLFAGALASFTTHQRKEQEELDFTYVIDDETAYSRDVPQFFDYDCSIQNFIYWKKTGGKDVEFKTWEFIIGELLKQGKLERNFFIENSILIQTKDWNNNAKSFFRKMLLGQHLSQEELVPFQESIFASLHSPFPPVTGFGMDLVKKIFEHQDFNTRSFLEWIEPLLMRSDCKATIKTALQVLEKIAKSHPDMRKKVNLLVADIFIIPDLTLQQRAAKFLAKFASENDSGLTDKLVSYAELMQGAVRNEMASLLGGPTESVAFATEIYFPSIAKEKVLTDKVSRPSTWNEIVFLFGEFIASEEILPTEMLLNSYILLRDLFPKDQAQQLKPYLKQLEDRHLSGYHRNYSSVFFQQKIHDPNYQFRIMDEKYDRVRTLLVIRPFLHGVQARMNSGAKIPMLSLPTHKPHWVEPKTLLQRIYDCQESNIALNWIDLAIAVARMPRENVEEAMPILEKLHGKAKDLMAFCLGVSDEIKVTPANKSFFGKLLSKISKSQTDPIEYAWAVAARTHYPDRVFAEFRNTDFGHFPMISEPFVPKIKFLEQWNEYKDYETGKTIRSATWQEFGFESPKIKWIPDALLYSLDLFRSKREFYAEITTEANVRYWNSLTPQNSDALALSLLQNTCAFTTGAAHDLKAFLQIMAEPGFRISEITQHVLACTFFHDSKEVRMTTSEIFGILIDKKMLDVAILGKQCAFLTDNKYAPFQRMSDCVAGIKDFSPLHNSALQQFYDSFLSEAHFNEKLPPNFKKLTEHYLDVSIKTGQKPTGKTKMFFEQNKDISSLKPLIKQLLD